MPSSILIGMILIGMMMTLGGKLFTKAVGFGTASFGGAFDSS